LGGKNKGKYWDVERPIILKAHEVRGILDGRQTQLRRIIKPQPHGSSDFFHIEYGNRKFSGPQAYLVDFLARYGCPFGKVGERLWVRETWQPLWAEAETPPPHGLKSPEGWSIGYPATDGIEDWYHPDHGLVNRCKSSTQMPRWASRILLEIVSVRVERLQDISDEDAKAEGAEEAGHTSRNSEFYKAGFCLRWSKIYSPRLWNSNPWVWVVDFKRVTA
jgi:hypothetical protein